MPLSGSTSTHDICDASNHSGENRGTSTPNSSPQSQPVRRVLALRSNFRKKMPVRPLQRKLAQKRNFALKEAPIPPAKRRQSTEAAVPATRVLEAVSPQRQREANPSRKQRSERPQGDIADGVRASNSTTSSRPDDRSDNPTTIGVTSDDIIRMLRDSEKRILRHIVTQQRSLLTKIEDLDAVVKELRPSVSKLTTGVSDLKLMVLPITTGSSLQRSSQRNPERPRKQNKALKLKMEVLGDNTTLAAEMNIVFDTDLVCAAAAKTIALQMVKYHSKQESVSISARALNVILYGLPRGGKKVQFKEGIGFRHAEFRFKILKTFVEFSKKLPSHLFAVEDTTENGDKRNEKPKTKTSWLTSDLVDLYALKQARRHTDLLAAEVPIDPTDPEKRKVLYIAKSFMKVVVDMLHLSRDTSRSKIFEEDIFLLADWNGFKWFHKDIANPVLSFCWPEVDPVPVHEIPDTATGDLDHAREANSSAMQGIIRDRKEMIVEVVYDVDVTTCVTADGRKKTNEGETGRRTLRRMINILCIAQSCLCSFCHTNEENILRTHPTMLKCLYRFALVLRGMFMEKICGLPDATTSNGQAEQNSEKGSVSRRPTVPASSMATSANGAERSDDANGRAEPRAQHSHGSTGTVRRKEISPITALDLYPSSTEVKRIVTNALTPSIDVFKKLHVIDRSETQRTGEIHSGEEEHDEEGLELESELESENDDMSDMLGDE